jgi:hypothetical protein
LIDIAPRDDAFRVNRHPADGSSWPHHRHNSDHKRPLLRERDESLASGLPWNTGDKHGRASQPEKQRAKAPPTAIREHCLLLSTTRTFAPVCSRELVRRISKEADQRCPHLLTARASITVAIGVEEIQRSPERRNLNPAS